MLSDTASRLAATIGVIGPHDLVAVVERVAEREFPRATLRSYPYANETEAVDLVADHSREVDAWLFTGVVPYTLVAHSGGVERPLTFIPYTGASIYRVLIGLLTAGSLPHILSVDTLDRDQITEALRDAGLDIPIVKVLEYRAGRTAAEFAAFHRAAAEAGRSAVAITCLRSVFEEISADVEAVRLAPAIASVRSALHTALLSGVGRIESDAQVALGLIRTPEPDDLLLEDVSCLAGSLFELGEASYLLVTTRGILEDQTEGLQRLPLLDRLATRHAWAHIGIGIGRTAAEAEALARRALPRSRSAGPFTALVSLSNGDDITLAGPEAGGPGGGEPGSVGLDVAARRSGLAVRTLERIRDLAAESGGVTAQHLSDALGVEPRSARRTLKRLERAGVARVEGHVRTGGTGRPATIYQLLY